MPCSACGHNLTIDHRGTTVAHSVSVEESSGLVIVRDFRSRAIPRDNPPNSNPPYGTVGPNVDQGFGDIHVMYDEANPPMQVQAWAGWPVEWETPLWNGAINPQLVSTLWTCVDLNTRQLASFPTYGMRGVSITKLPEWSNNPEPEVYSDWTEAAKQLFNTFQGGECFLWATGRFADGSVARWVVLNPSFVNVEWSDGEVEYRLGGQLLDAADILHIKYQSMPGNLRGIGPMQWAAKNIISASALERMGTDLATRGGIPWGVIKHPRKLNSQDTEDLRNRWVTASRDRRGAPAILSGGIELQTLTISPKEMMMLESRVFDETRIAAAFGVPPFLIGLPQPDGMTYSNVNALFDYHWRSCLRPMASAVASAISRWCLPRGTRMEFNRDEYTRATMKERAETYAILNKIVDEKGNPAMTVDEIRMAERFIPNSPVDDMQAHVEAANL